MKLRLTSIQRFSVHDGPGIRTTLFTKGCSIRCPWCANPENLSHEIQSYCTKTGDWKHYGDDYSVGQVFEICLRDKNFYGKDGGVTASGGEALLQAEPLAELFRRLRAEQIGCCLETSLYAPRKNLELVKDYLDYIYVDMKVLDEKQAEDILQATLRLYEENLEYLFSEFPHEKICIRIPLVDKMTLTDKNLNLIREHLRRFQPMRCEIFSVHNLGSAKYATLNLTYQKFRQITEKELLRVKGYFQEQSGDTSFIINHV